ncbi:hypothetical protein FRACA_340021 [Frankia canadensis]|uniref:Transposase IS66 central domain-containing protein n=1 Tax=Frankia canadensis TaxID=1836972 RepID=A0A2I2KV30_9ACTN|nr:hypothetical protein FRACA_340021 [Frankia canadensis]SOU56801.1 hypothetical protein FRACA_340021 [Frankia canadensis]
MAGTTRAMVDDPDGIRTADPSLCGDCGFPLAGAPRATTRRHQIVEPPPPLHAWCGAHTLRDLRSIHDGDPDGQLWAEAMATTLLDAHHAACDARDTAQNALAPEAVAFIRNHYRDALARGETDNHGDLSSLAHDARTLIRRMRREEDMILRFVVDPTVPFSNNQAERAVRPVKVQQRTSGGCWRTLAGLVDFAVVQSYLSTAANGA